MAFKKNRKWMLAALCSAAISISSPMFQSAFAQSHSGGKGGSSHTTEADHGDDHGEGGKKLMRGGSAQRGGGHGSLRDVFNEMEEEAVENPIGRGISPGAKKQTGKPAVTGGHTDTEAAEEEGEDSDKPDFAGTPGPKSNSRSNPNPGSNKGDIYGDMYVVLRNEDGIPETETITVDGESTEVVKVYYQVDATGDPLDGTVACCMDRDAATGDLLLTKEIDGTTYNVVPVEVELGRLSVGRSPVGVLAAQYDDAITTINDAVSVEYDDAGRIVATLDDGTVQTIDSPLANLALYDELVNTGTLEDVNPDKLVSLGIADDQTISANELLIAASLYGAASDKTITISEDSIEYMNAILKIDGTIINDTSGDNLLDGSYVDYTSVSYVPSAQYDVNVQYLVIGTDENGDGVPDTSWVSTNLLDVLGYTDADKDTAITNVEGFTAAADDARQIIDFFHEYTVIPAATE